MKARLAVFFSVFFCAAMDTSWAQFGGIRRAVGAAEKGVNTANAKLKDLKLTEAEEIELGTAVSAKVRQTYGVVQDPAVHKYVTLVGTTVARKSSRATLPWQFIVLDTDGVNAFAAPGGFIHITRGALALAKNEAELAGVLAHELSHVTGKHTVEALEKNKGFQMLADETNIKANSEYYNRLVDESTKLVFAGFGRSEELEADADGIGVTGKAGYAAGGLKSFLITLQERNKGSAEKQGLFASHPEMTERLQKMDSAIAKQKTTATLAERYASFVKYKAVALGDITVDTTSATASDEKTASEAKKEEPAKKDEGQSRLSLSGLRNAVGGGKESTQSATVTGSGASRGVDKERYAKGGSNPAVVAVTVTPAELTEFIRQGGLVG